MIFFRTIYPSMKSWNSKTEMMPFSASPSMEKNLRTHHVQPVMFLVADVLINSAMRNASIASCAVTAIGSP